MENTITTDVPAKGRFEIYDNVTRPEKGFAPNTELKPITHMTQGNSYEILEEKFHPKGMFAGMIYVVKDDEGNTRHISDKYFYQPDPILIEPKQSDINEWRSHCLDADALRKAYESQPVLKELKEKMKHDFDVNLSHMPPIPGQKPTVQGLTEAAEFRVELNRLAGTYKEQKTATKVRKSEQRRDVKSSIEEELDALRSHCMDMIDRIDALSNAVETVRKFA